MSQEILKTISIKDFVQTGLLMEYADYNVLVAGNLKAIESHELIRFDFCLVILCEDGHAQINVNNRVYALQKDDMMICFPFSVLQGVSPDNDLKVTVLGCSSNLFNTILKGEDNTDAIVNFVHKKPVWNISRDKQGKNLFFRLEKIIMEKADSNVGYCRKKIFLYLFCALFGELMATISTMVQASGQAMPKRGANVFRSFMDEVVKDEGMHRSVAYYANLLCYSPKYVSYVVKAVSGKTASHWINENAMEHIKYHLKYSDMSIKEIANHFNFPNISFFGKYVKRYVGMSPMQYRNLPEGKQNVCVASKI